MARSLRLYVSSAPEMSAERELLAERVYPRLRASCARRGADFSAVDLRLGRDSEAEGELADHALGQIERCLPFFVALLGPEAGPIPGQLPAELLERVPWLARDAGEVSVQELEIKHAFLRDPDEGRFAMFFLRDGAERAMEGSRAGRRLAALVNRLRELDAPLAGYADPEALAIRLEDELEAIVTRAFPLDRIPGVLEVSRAREAGYARALLEPYIPRTEPLTLIRRFDEEDRRLISVTGEPGTGKSALIAEWLRSRPKREGELVLTRFLGARPTVSRLGPLLRGMNRELAAHLDREQQQSSEPDAARFAELLNIASGDGVLLVLDGLDHLEEDDGSLELDWLPWELPSGVRIVISTRQGAAAQRLADRGWSVGEVSVDGLDREERSALCELYLARRGGLQAAVADSIADHREGANPRRLRAILAEASRLAGDRAGSQQLEELIAAADLEALYRIILDRLEAEDRGSRAGLVDDALRLLAVAREGLTEGDLIELLGNGEDGPLPYPEWLWLREACGEMVAERDELYALAEGPIRSVVAERLLSDPAAEREARERIVRMIQAAPPAPRSFEELPWQLAALERWDELAQSLRGASWLTAQWERDPAAVIELWRLLEASSDYEVESAYGRSVLLGVPQALRPAFAQTVRSLFAAFGSAEPDSEAAAWMDAAEREPNARWGEAQAALEEAVEHHEREQWEAAKREAQRAVELYRELASEPGLALALNELGVAFAGLGDFDRAIETHAEEARICRRSDLETSLARCLGRWGLAHRAKGDHERARELFREQEALARRLESDSVIVESVGNRGLLERDAGNQQRAEDLLQEALRIADASGHDDLATQIRSRLGGDEAAEQDEEPQTKEPKRLALKSLTGVLDRAGVLANRGGALDDLLRPGEAPEVAARYWLLPSPESEYDSVLLLTSQRLCWLPMSAERYSSIERSSIVGAELLSNESITRTLVVREGGYEEAVHRFTDRYGESSDGTSTLPDVARALSADRLRGADAGRPDPPPPPGSARPEPSRREPAPASTPEGDQTLDASDLEDDLVERALREWRIDEAWGPALKRELGPNERPLGLLMTVGNFVVEDTLLAVTDERVLWLERDQLIGESPRDRVKGLKIPLFSLGPLNITLKLRGGRERVFPIWGRRRRHAKQLAALLKE